MRRSFEQQSPSQRTGTFAEHAQKSPLEVESAHARVRRQSVAICAIIQCHRDDAQKTIDFRGEVSACSLFSVHFVSMISDQVVPLLDRYCSYCL
jgi:hypothetical protein